MEIRVFEYINKLKNYRLRYGGNSLQCLNEALDLKPYKDSECLNYVVIIKDREGKDQRLDLFIPST